MLDFEFLRNGLGIVSPPHFVYDFSKKCFLLTFLFSYCLLLTITILLTDQICVPVIVEPVL